MSLVPVLVGMSMAMSLLLVFSDYLQRRKPLLLFCLALTAMLGFLSTVQPLALVFVFIMYLLTLQLRFSCSHTWLLPYIPFVVLFMIGIWLATYFQVFTPPIIWMSLLLLIFSVLMFLIGSQLWAYVASWSLALIISAAILLLPVLNEKQSVLIVTVLAQFIMSVFILRLLQKKSHSNQPDLQTVTAIQVEERSRIYRNIHDDVGADLLRLVYQLENTEQQQQVKQIMHRLRQAVAQTIQVEISLKQLIEELTGQAKSRLQLAGINFHSEVQLGFKPTFNNTHPANIMRIMNELIANICKHADAKNVTMQIASQETDLRITIIDDGCGIQALDLKSGGRGLRGLRQRAESMGADISWQNSDNGGTETRLKYPWT